MASLNSPLLLKRRELVALSSARLSSVGACSESPVHRRIGTRERIMITRLRVKVKETETPDGNRCPGGFARSCRPSSYITWLHLMATAVRARRAGVRRFISCRAGAWMTASRRGSNEFQSYRPLLFHLRGSNRGIRGGFDLQLPSQQMEKISCPGMRESRFDFHNRTEYFTEVVSVKSWSAQRFPSDARTSGTDSSAMLGLHERQREARCVRQTRTSK